MKRFLPVILFLAFTFTLQAGTYTVKKGETLLLNCTATAPSNGWITHVFFEYVDPNDAEYLGISYSSQECCATLYGLKAKDRIPIEVTYHYSYRGSYDNNIHVGHGTYTDYITVLGPPRATSFAFREGKEIDVPAGGSTIVHVDFYPSGSEPSDFSFGFVSTFGQPYDFIAKSVEGTYDIEITAKNSPGSYVYLAAYMDNNQSTAQVATIKIVPAIDPQSVSIPNNLTVYVGETQTITPVVSPSDAQTTFTWYSTASGKAEVSNGVVRGVDEGTAQVYCRTSNGIESNRCNVSVYYRTPTGIEVSPSNVTLNLYETKQLTYSVKPSNAKTTVTWHSEDVNEKVVRLSSSGLVTPVGPGTARVYAQTDNNYKGYCNITVLPDPDKIEVPQKMLLMYGDSRKIDCKVSPSNAYAQLAWASDNPSVARVRSDGTIEAVGGGSANITVTTHNGKTATAYVEVPEPNFRMHVWLRDGSSVSYPIKSHPKVQFPDGKVVLSGQGIDAEFDSVDFNRLTFSNEMISPMPTSIDMPSSLRLAYGERYQMPYTLQPEDFDFVTRLAWSTTDSHVAVVNASGVVTAVGGGEADIVCEASNGCKALCRVSVPEPEFYFVVWLKDGRKSVTHLREKPMLRYADEAYTLVTSSSETVYDAADVVKITLADNPDGNVSGIEGVEADYVGGSHGYALGDNTMVISGGTPAAVTSVYTVAGVLVASFKANEQGCTVVPLSDLPRGVLIIQSEKVTYKIIKK